MRLKSSSIFEWVNFEKRIMNNYTQYEDKELLALLREKSPVYDQAFYALYLRYSEKLNSYCIFRSDNQRDAEEIFQDTWLRFCKWIQSGNAVDSVQAYLFKIARNISIDRYRVQNNQKVLNLDNFNFEQISDPINLQSLIEKDELLSLISQAVNNLPVIYKETFLLYWFSGFTYLEISEILGETVDCVKKRSYRAMEDIIKILEPIISENSRKESK